MSTYTDEELDSFEKDLEEGNFEEGEQVQDNVEDDNAGEPQGEPENVQEQTEDQPGEEGDNGETPTDETLTQDEEDFLDKYLKENPLEAKSKSARFMIDSRAKMQESANKALDYHKKTMELARWRDDIAILQSGEITKDDLILMAEAKRGNKDAIAKMAQLNNVDVFELDEEAAENYAPQREYATGPQLEMQELAQELLADEVVAPAMESFSNDMPDDFREALSTNSAVLKGFAQDIRSGAAKEIYPHAVAAQAMHGGSFIQHYQQIGMKMFGQEQQPQAQPQAAPNEVEPQKRQVSERERNLRQKAFAPRGGQQSKSFLNDAQSIWDMPEDEFDSLSNEDLAALK
jgi:hypothetical protein